MDFSEVKELIGLMNNSDLAYFELKNKKDYIKIDKSMSREYINLSENHQIKDKNTMTQTDSNDAVNLDNSIREEISPMHTETKEEGIEYITSPIVGTYYEAISPTSDPFVTINQVIKKGEIICIVEAMKLMNEITADFDCEIIEILGKDGKMVEYGQPLLKIRRL